MYDAALTGELVMFVKGGCTLIACCSAGVSLVAYVDERSSESKSAAHSSLVGDLLCVLSACFYASYTIAIRVMLKDDESTSMMLFFGFVGALNLVCLAPVLGLLWLASVVDPGQLSGKMFGLTVAKGESWLWLNIQSCTLRALQVFGNASRCHCSSCSARFASPVLPSTLCKRLQAA